MPAAIDLSPYLKLHAVTVLRDLVRKWWRLELFLVDGTGEAVAARPIPRDNDFCRLSLHAPLGARRCADSLRVTLDRLRETGRGCKSLVHECHLGFDIPACALWLDGAVAGYVAVSGSVHEGFTAYGEAQLLRKVREVAPAAGEGTDLERALRRVPFLSRGEMEQVEDLLHLCADEIQAHHESLARQRAAPDEADAEVPAADDENTPAPGSLRAALVAVERDLIEKGLRRTGGNKSQLARELGISRSNLQTKVDRYGLDDPR
jgi:hypothetical protein